MNKQAAFGTAVIVTSAVLASAAFTVLFTYVPPMYICLGLLAIAAYFAVTGIYRFECDRLECVDRLNKLSAKNNKE